MRDIRFRAWNGEAMEYGGFSVHATAGNIQPTPLTKVTAESPLMQYTGLKDKNGVEIYEGDIVESGVEYWTNRNRMVVKWDDEDGAWSKWWPRAAFEVIGNKWENPELLDEKE